MALKIRIETDFREVSAFIEGVPDSLDVEIPGILNASGSKMTDAATAIIAVSTDSSIGEVGEALIERNATQFLSEYSVSSRGDKFPYVRWITRRDEKVCPICGPRDGKTFTTMEIRYIYPAHPNCRCMIEPVSIADELVATAPIVVPPAANEVVDEIMKVFERQWNFKK